MVRHSKTKQCKCLVVLLLSCFWLFETPGIVARQAPLSMGFPRQKYWCGLPVPPSGDLSNPGIRPTSPASLADSLPLSHHESLSVTVGQIPSTRQNKSQQDKDVLCLWWQKWSSHMIKLWIYCRMKTWNKNEISHTHISCDLTSNTFTQLLKLLSEKQTSQRHWQPFKH